MARVGKDTKVTVELELGPEFAKQLAKEIVRELKENFSDFTMDSVRVGELTSTNISTIAKEIESVVQIDESIIPTKVDVDAIEAENTEAMTKESVKEDKDLDKSKSKLSKILRKK